MKKTLFIIAFLISISLLTSGQEVITGLAVNPVIIKQNKNNKYSIEQATNPIVVQRLPFIDDFSYQSIYPVDTLWLDNYAFINSDYPVDPPTIGVATLDAINDIGGIYSNAGAFPFIADFLTSQPIRLDSSFALAPTKLTPADSIYFSFYFQPQGIGNHPNDEDSLVVEFYSPIYNAWRWIWSSTGSKLSDFYDTNNTYFKSVMIPIIDTNFFTNEFQFRFKNYASLANNNIPSWASNVDHWNIDFVYLDLNRNKDSIAINDVAITKKITSLLKNYESMPWRQFIADSVNEMKDTVKTLYRNLSKIEKNVAHIFKITDLSQTTPPYTPLITANGNMPGLSDSTFVKILNYVFDANVPANSNPAFEVLSIIDPQNSVIYNNDTIRFYQKFYNYYAYDDGVPESGYGLSPGGARLAYSFTLNIPDTLRSIQMFFNQVLNSTQIYFYLTVWDDNNGEPGNVIYEKGGVSPEYPSGLNMFHTYVLDNPVPVNGTFYIGWRQTSNDNLNLGFDRNINKQSKIWYNVDGTWNNSMFEGALMMRPILGSEQYPHVGEKELLKEKFECKIFPNPVNDGVLFIEISDKYNDLCNDNDFEIKIYNITGKEILVSDYQQSINVSSLTDGIYFIRIMNEKTSESFIDKLVIIH